MSLEYIQKNFKAEQDNLNIVYHAWIPKNIKKVFIIQHGFGGHGCIFDNVISALNDDVTAFYAMDLRGNGLSDGQRGKANNVQEYVNDLRQFISIVGSMYSQLPLVLFGHSMGGGLVLKYLCDEAQQSPITHLVVSGPAIEICMDFKKKIKKFLGEILYKLFPNLVINAGIDAEELTHDIKEQEKFKNDPLIHSMLSLSVGVSLLDVGPEILAHAHMIKIPIYIFHGGADTVTCASGSRHLMAAVSSDDKTLNIYPGLRHETFNEKAKDRGLVLSDLQKWLGQI